MVATVTKTIESAMGRDYTTINAWIAAMPVNLVTDGSEQIGEMYRASAGEGVYNNANKSTNPLTFNSSNGVTVTTTNLNNFLIDNRNNNTTIEGLQITSDFNGTDNIILQDISSSSVAPVNILGQIINIFTSYLILTNYLFILKNSAPTTALVLIYSSGGIRRTKWLSY